jgi:hypothetical protein
MPPVPQTVPSVTSLQTDELTTGWQLSHAFVGFAAPLAYVVPPMTQAVPASRTFASETASAPPLEPELLPSPASTGLGTSCKPAMAAHAVGSSHGASARSNPARFIVGGPACAAAMEGARPD